MFLAVAGMVVSAPGIYADNISVGDLITLQDGPGGWPGGEFQVYKGGTKQFDTFCIEGGEYFTTGIPFKVVGISEYAVLGGEPFPGDKLESGTAYLYHNFRYGILSNYVYNGAGRETSATQLQIAIWAFENEEGYTVNNVPAGSQAATWITEAQNAVGNHVWVGLGDVRALNLEWNENWGGFTKGQRAQDQLTLVPEPGILILLGIALSAVGLAARRYRLIP